ncbi:MAG: universal stress protein [Anaerolineae bacterium]|nr:universal stress protein [Anaerolineae bacterium]
MATILCATRGGEASIRTQEHVIATAKERGAGVVFLYVTDVTFMGNLMTHAEAVETEMEHMGEFLLLMAKERAEKQGVTAGTVVKRGEFRLALVEAAKEAGASMIALGRPAEGGFTRLDFLEALAAAVEQETGIETVIV